MKDLQIGDTIKWVLVGILSKYFEILLEMVQSRSLKDIKN